MMGPFDLSVGMGSLRDPVNERVKEVMMVAEKAVLDSDSETYLAGCAMPNDGPVELGRRGYHLTQPGSFFSSFQQRRGNNGDRDGSFKASAQEIRTHFATLRTAFEH
uniref:Uncharacterized protein n=1 Tax=Quercus lobata TaxID=97700 RepID=A0A7N2KUN5_QUELO